MSLIIVIGLSHLSKRFRAEITSYLLASFAQSSNSRTLKPRAVHSFCIGRETSVTKVCSKNGERDVVGLPSPEPRSSKAGRVDDGVKEGREIEEHRRRNCSLEKTNMDPLARMPLMSVWQ